MKNNDAQKGFAMPAIIAIIALVVVIGVVSYFSTRNQSKTAQSPASETILEDSTVTKADGTTKTNEAMIKPDGTMIEPDGTMVNPDGIMAKYTGTVLAGKSTPLLDFTKSDYDAAIKTDKLVVLYFYANWCPICKAEFPVIQGVFNGLITDKVIGFRVNYNDDQTDNDEKNLAKQFGVAYQHTKVFAKNGQRILKSPEGWNKKRYDMEISKALGQ